MGMLKIASLKLGHIYHIFYIDGSRLGEDLAIYNGTHTHIQFRTDTDVDLHLLAQDPIFGDYDHFETSSKYIKSMVEVPLENLPLYIGWKIIKPKMTDLLRMF
jgi:hypothetical protein